MSLPPCIRSKTRNLTGTAERGQGKGPLRSSQGGQTTLSVEPIKKCHRRRPTSSRKPRKLSLGREKKRSNGSSSFPSIRDNRRVVRCGRNRQKKKEKGTRRRTSREKETSFADPPRMHERKKRRCSGKEEAWKKKEDGPRVGL